MTRPDRTRPPEPGPIRPFEFPRVERHRLADEGLEVLSARDDDLPLVSARLTFDAGAATEPDGAGGVAGVVANALDTGTADRSADELSLAFERLGVELDARAGWDATAVTITAARDRFENALSLFADVVRNAAFPSDQVERVRDERLADILQRRKEPRSLADDMAARFIFDDGVPYARPSGGTRETVASLSRDTVTGFYESRYRPGNAALTVVGDIGHDRARELASSHFGDWTGGAAPPAEFTVEPRVREPTIFLVHRPGAVQSEIRIGHVGVERRHPDYFALLVMNTILGGAFTSRLNMNLREKHGFTYGARSSFGFRRRPGPFVVQAAVATDVTARAVEEAVGELRALRADGATPDEVASARDYLRGVLPLRLQTTAQLTARIAQLFVYDLPTDYLHRYRDHIAGVSADDVHRVAREHIRTDELTLVVVGDADQVGAPLRELGIGDVRVREAE